MSYEIIVLDIDGTLVNSKKEITDRTQKALTRLQATGKKVALASGRPVQGIMPYAHALRLDSFGGYVLAYNGGCVIDARSNEVFTAKIFPTKLFLTFAKS